MKNEGLLAVPLVLIVALQWQPVAFAQALALEEIIVTATKRESSLQDIAVTVTAFSDEMIQEAGINNAQDVAIFTPSLTIAQNVSPFTARINIRGIGTAQTDPALEPSVGLFVDGVFMGRSGLGMSDLTDIERIEVLQGPQGTLYGKNTNAGAISVITKQPNLEEMEGYVEASVGDYALRKLTATVSAPFSEKAAFRLSGNINQQDGYLENFAPGGADLNDADDWNLQGKLLFVPIDNLSITLAGSHVERDTSCCGADALQNQTTLDEFAARSLADIPNDPFDYKIAVNDDSAFELEADALTLTIEVDLDWGTIESISAWNEYEFTSTADADRSQLDVLAIRGDLGKGDSLSQELRLSASAGDAVDYQVGLFYYEQTTQRGDGRPWVTVGNDLVSVASQQDLSFLPLPIGLIATPGDSLRTQLVWDNRTLALFGQSTFHITDSWNIVAGLRWTDEDKEADFLSEISAATPFSLLQTFAGPIDEEFERGSDDVNWLLSSSVDVNDDVMLFVSVATGTKSGGFNGVSGTPEEREFPDESTISYELGIKSTLLDSRLRVNATAFYTEIEDYQTQQQLPQGVGTIVGTDGEVISSGLDLNVEALPAPFLSLNLGLIYQDRAEITEGPQAGLALPFVAEVSGNLGAVLRLPLAVVAFMSGRTIALWVIILLMPRKLPMRRTCRTVNC